MSMEMGLWVIEDDVVKLYGAVIKGIMEWLKYNKMWYLLVDRDILPGTS